MDIIKPHMGGEVCDITTTIFMPKKTAFGHYKTKDGRKLVLFEDTKDVSGTVTISVREAHVIEHFGIRAEFICSISLPSEKPKKPHQLAYHCVLLSKGKRLYGREKFRFSFSDEFTKWESFHGNDLTLRYFVRITIVTPMLIPDIKSEEEIWVHRPFEEEPGWMSDVARLDSTHLFTDEAAICIGYKDRLFAKFCLEKRVYSIGQMNYIPMRIEVVCNDVKEMKACLMRRETEIFGGESKSSMSEIMSIVMDEGDPVPGSATRRLMFELGESRDITPTFDCVENKFSVQYFVRIIVITRDGMSRSGEQEILFWRPRSGKHEIDGDTNNRTKDVPSEWKKYM